MNPSELFLVCVWRDVADGRYGWRTAIERIAGAWDNDIANSRTETSALFFDARTQAAAREAFDHTEQPRHAKEKSIALPTDTPALEAGRVVFLPIDAILRDDTQPRTDFNAEALQDLAESIKTRGVKHPVVVRSDYVIEDGERRWRAAKLAGLETVPCILAGPADEKSPALERAMDQVTQNTLREPLNPMEWARFFLRLREEFGLTVEEMSDTMSARGLKMSRPYISNLMRLAALPEWAQTKISAGELTAAHGKVLLTAQASPKVLAMIEKDLKGAAPRTTEDLQNEIDEAFNEAHINLRKTWGNDPVLFDTKQCNGCESLVEIKTSSGYASRYCINPTHFNELQAVAKAAAEGKAAKQAERKERPPAPPKPPKLNADGVFESRTAFNSRFAYLDDAEFDTAVCEKCEWKKPVSIAGRPPEPACFNVPEYELKRAAARRNHGRAQRVADHLDQWVRQQLAVRLEIDKRLQFHLLTYLALGQPGSYDLMGRGRGAVAQAAGVRHIAAHLALLDGAGFPADKVLPVALEHLYRGELYHLARYAGVELTPRTYRIDASYIDLCKKADIVRLIESTDLKFEESWTEAQRGKLPDLKAYALTDAAVAAVGVPRDVMHIWESNDVDPRDYDDEENNEEETNADTDEA